MASIKIMSSFMAAFLLMLLVAPKSDAVITCGTVITNIRPCIQYLMSGNGKPPAPCCAGASALARAAATTADKQAACACLKNASKNINMNVQLAKSLPANCGINLPYAISPYVDCTKIH